MAETWFFSISPHWKSKFERKEKQNTENRIGFDIIRSCRLCDIGIFSIIQLKTHCNKVSQEWKQKVFCMVN